MNTFKVKLNWLKSYLLWYLAIIITMIILIIWSIVWIPFSYFFTGSYNDWVGLLNNVIKNERR